MLVQEELSNKKGESEMDCKKCKNEEMVTIPFAAHKIVVARKEREKNRLKIALVASWIIEAVIIAVIMLH